jgi:thiol-disulfide isomerase/thioredoxin
MSLKRKKIFQNKVGYSTLVLFVLIMSNCQPILKAPAAAIMSTTLPTPQIDSVVNNNYPMADYNLQVTGLNGGLVKLNNYKGKVIFLNFWATWCMPCVSELPSINKLYKQFKNEDILFLLITNENIEKVKKYKQRKSYEVPFFIQDEKSIIPNIYYSPGIPTTFIINRKGEIIKASSGAEDWDDKEFVETLRELVR